jgi:hypothetical protein
MEYQERYELELLIEGKEFEIMPSMYSFTMSDSIYQLYPRMNMSISDDTSLLQEYLATIEGITYEVTFGLKNNIIKCPFIIKGDELPENSITGLIGGEVIINFIHEYFSKQNAISKVYDNTISKIIEKLVNKYNFNSKNIDITNSSSKWYQPLITDSKFMLKNLLPFAYSADCGDTPYYLFIDVNNDFYFRSFKTMFETNPVTDLYITSKNINGSNSQSIQRYGRYRPGSDLTYNLRHRVVCQIDDSDGSFSTEDDHLTDYPSNTKQVPIKYTKDNVTSYMWIDKKEDDSAIRNNNKGFKINNMRNAMLLDKIVVELPFNPTLRSGKTINLILPYDNDGEESTLLFSGKYLIDRSWHTWDRRNGSTILSVGRKNANVPNSGYNLKDLLARK